MDEKVMQALMRLGELECLRDTARAILSENYPDTRLLRKIFDVKEETE